MRLFGEIHLFNMNVFYFSFWKHNKLYEIDLFHYLNLSKESLLY